MIGVGGIVLTVGGGGGGADDRVVDDDDDGGWFDMYDFVGWAFGLVDVGSGVWAGWGDAVGDELCDRRPKRLSRGR